MNNTKRNSSAEAITVLVICAVIVLNLILGTLVKSFGLAVYAEESVDLSVGDVGDTLFADAIEKGKRVTVTFCMYEDDVAAHSTGKYVYRTAKEFEEKYPDFIELNYVNALTQLDASGRFFDFEKYKTDMRGKGNKIYTTSIIFECDGVYRVITDAVTSAGYADFFTLDSSFVATSYNGEEFFASMVAWVLNPEHGTAYFTKGHGETATLTLYNLLTCAGYYVEELNLKLREIPDDADLVIISNPRSDFERAAAGSTVRTETEMERLHTYAQRGGNFFVALDPYTKSLPVLESFLSEFGIGFFETDEGERQIVKDFSDAITTDGFTLVTSLAAGEHTAPVREVIRDGRVIIKDAAALALSGEAKPLLTASSSAVCQSGGTTTDTAGSYVLAAASSLANEDAESAKMFAISSIYLAAADAIITNGYSNKDFIYSLFDTFFGMGDMPYGCRSVVYDNQILENLTMGTARLYTAALVAIPVLIAAAGVFVIVRRKNR